MGVVDRLNQPNTPEDCFDTWKHRGRIAVPSKQGGLVEVRIEQIEWEGPLIRISGRTHNAGSLAQFYVIFKQWPKLRLPALMWKDGCGEWIRR